MDSPNRTIDVLWQANALSATKVTYNGTDGSGDEYVVIRDAYGHVQMTARRFGGMIDACQASGLIDSLPVADDVPDHILRFRVMPPATPMA